MKHAGWLGIVLLLSLAGAWGQRTDTAWLLRRLTSSQPATRASAAEALGQIAAEDAVGALMPLLADPAPQVRYAAAVALGRIDSPCDGLVPGLARCLTDQEVPVRLAAAWALGYVGGAEAVPGLLAAAQGENPALAAEAVGALGRIGDPSAVPGLLALPATLADDDGASQPIRRAIGRIGARAVPTLTAALADPAPRRRAVAVLALGAIAQRAVLAPLRGALGDADPGVRRRAVAALRDLEDAGALPALTVATRDADPAVAAAATEAVHALQGPAPAAEPLPDTASTPLPAPDPTGLAPLLDAYDHGRYLPRERLLEPLARYADPQVTRRLLAATYDVEPAVQIVAARALGRSGVPGAVEALQDMLVAHRDDLHPTGEADSPCRAAIEGLGATHDPRAAETLLALLRGEDRTHARAAAEALVALGDAHAAEAMLAVVATQIWRSPRDLPRLIGRVAAMPAPPAPGK